MEAQQKRRGKCVKGSAGLLCLHYYMHSIVVSGKSYFVCCSGCSLMLAF